LMCFHLLVNKSGIHRDVQPASEPPGYCHLIRESDALLKLSELRVLAKISCERFT